MCYVYVPHMTSDAKIQPAVTGREDSYFWLFSLWSRVGHALRSNFMLWLVKIWEVSSCGKFMQHLESCLLWQLGSFVSTCDVFNCLPLFMASLFFWFLVEKYVTCQSRKFDFGWHRFRFAPCLMRKRVAKSEALLALTWYLSGLHLEW